MSGEITGGKQLSQRLHAIGDGRKLLGRLQLKTVYHAKQLVPRRTGNLGRSITPGSLSSHDAYVRATAAYAAPVELGSRAHDIVPRTRKSLRFPAKGTPTTLGGRVRSGVQGGYVFAKKVHIPAQRPRPYLRPGAKMAVTEDGVDIIVTLWNDAA